MTVVAWGWSVKNKSEETGRWWLVTLHRHFDVVRFLMDISNVSQPADSRVQADRSKIAALATLSLGALFIFIIGFSHIDVLHNAAHDTRHAAGFPCH